VFTQVREGKFQVTRHFAAPMPIKPHPVYLTRGLFGKPQFTGRWFAVMDSSRRNQSKCTTVYAPLRLYELLSSRGGMNDRSLYRAPRGRQRIHR
jgi:hypothetical protein